MISDTGKLLGTRAVPTDTPGYAQLLIWAPSFGSVGRAGAYS
ncbi:MAG: IS110 family transposase, partial [Gammaproteobacteria bacterium]|nr:IS110 family transposase [Gammaproteobacteria bacterium]